MQGSNAVEAPGATQQDAAQDAGVPLTAQDPADWVPVTEVRGVAVETNRLFYPSGRLRRIYTSRPGVLGPRGHEGRDLELYETGVIQREAHWVAGRMEGPYREWFEGGQIRVLTQFVAGQRSGLYQEYGELGVLRVQANYLDGALHGEFRRWFETEEPQ
ncbi:MAG: hypothetical protein KDB61_16350, partial [Planctomycetes bacterium]|nr:hypothetical protein [Planctomycetota bacterium]